MEVFHGQNKIARPGAGCGISGRSKFPDNRGAAIVSAGVLDELLEFGDSGAPYQDFFGPARKPF
jgi:hypothetical protein